MNPILWISTAGLVAVLAFVAVKVFGREPMRGSRLQGISIAGIIILLVGWPAVQWLRVGHPEATQVRYAAVWVQAVCAFGTALLFLVSAWQSKTLGPKIP